MYWICIKIDQNMSKGVNLDKIISRYDTIFDFGVKFDVFDVCYVLWLFDVMFHSKMNSLSHVSNKVLRAKWPHKSGKNNMSSVKTQLYKFRPLCVFSV